jgi:hypothetical protein
LLILNRPCFNIKSVFNVSNKLSFVIRILWWKMSTTWTIHEHLESWGGPHFQIDIYRSLAVPVTGGSARYYLLMIKGVTRQWFMCMFEKRPEPITTRLVGNLWSQIVNVVSLGSERSQLLHLYLVYSLNTPKKVRLVRNCAREAVPRI